MAYPADTYAESVELTITASNQLHTLLNGDATTEITVEDGSKIPSVRKAYTDSLFFLSPQPWTVGEYETIYNQLRAFVEPTEVTTWWFSKTATISTPTLMSTTPHDDSNWTLWNAINNSVYETQKRLAAEAGLNMVGSFLLGTTATNTDDVVFYETDGKYYSWGGTLPKVVTSGSTPSTSGGIGASLWVDRTDLTFRNDLSASDGEKLIGQCPDIATLRTIEPTVSGQFIKVAYYALGVDGGGMFRYDASSSASDNGVTVIVTAEGKRWRRYSDMLSAADYGASSYGSIDISAAVDRMNALGTTVTFKKGTYKISSTKTVTVPCVFESGAGISPDSGVTVTFNAGVKAGANYISGSGTVVTSSNPSTTWGYSSSVPLNATNSTKITRTASTDAQSPVSRTDITYNADAAVGVDFSGASGGSIPFVYVGHEQTGSSSANQAFTHSIMAYALNSAVGDNDVIALSGRARKKDVVGGVGDSAGVWGSAYQESTKSGGVMGMETHIYQNVAGQGAQDRLNSKWSVGLHVYSASTGSPALAGVAIDSAVESGGYGFWNAILIDRNAFSGNGLDGTVGINMSSCNTTYNPKYGIKFGSAYQHIYSITNLTLAAANSIYIDTSASGTAIFLQLSTASTSNVVIQSGGTSFAEFRGADKKLHLRNAAVVDIV